MNREDFILRYFRMGFRNSEILHALANKHGIVISIRTLKRISQRLSLYRRKNYSHLVEVALFIIEQCQESGSQHGYRWMYAKCIMAGFAVSQKTVRLMLSIIDPEGVKQRSKKRLQRRKYSNPGPNYVWHIDG